jgi:hypothetical protein
MAKSTNAELEKRYLEVYALITKGYTYSNIVRHCKEKYCVLSTRTVHKYIKSATDLMRKDHDKTKEQLRTEANNRYDDLYKQLYKEGKYGEASRVQALKNKINGLEVQEISGSITTRIQVEYVGADTDTESV